MTDRDDTRGEPCLAVPPTAGYTRTLPQGVSTMDALADAMARAVTVMNRPTTVATACLASKERATPDRSEKGSLGSDDRQRKSEQIAKLAQTTLRDPTDLVTGACTRGVDHRVDAQIESHDGDSCTRAEEKDEPTIAAVYGFVEIVDGDRVHGRLPDAPVCTDAAQDNATAVACDVGAPARECERQVGPDEAKKAAIRERVRALIAATRGCVPSRDSDSHIDAETVVATDEKVKRVTKINARTQGADAIDSPQPCCRAPIDSVAAAAASTEVDGIEVPMGVRKTAIDFFARRSTTTIKDGHYVTLAQYVGLLSTLPREMEMEYGSYVRLVRLTFVAPAACGGGKGHGEKQRLQEMGALDFNDTGVIHDENGKEIKGIDPEASFNAISLNGGPIQVGRLLDLFAPLVEDGLHADDGMCVNNQAMVLRATVHIDCEPGTQLANTRLNPLWHPPALNKASRKRISGTVPIAPEKREKRTREAIELGAQCIAKGVKSPHVLDMLRRTIPKPHRSKTDSDAHVGDPARVQLVRMGDRLLTRAQVEQEIGASAFVLTRGLYTVVGRAIDNAKSHVTMGETDVTLERLVALCQQYPSDRAFGHRVAVLGTARNVWTF